VGFLCEGISCGWMNRYVFVLCTMCSVWVEVKPWKSLPSALHMSSCYHVHIVDFASSLYRDSAVTPVSGLIAVAMKWRA
jgi:hypothetical protein